ncbi:Treh [Ramazzottius varieornatus]|uniref:Trehalase n=1 Tax=Ramazzottius varieornatus TaxID=947166 RepID=A0A1D1VL67_RAMVA|nr:Treh [Ramazzottius varieornatus]
MAAVVETASPVQVFASESKDACLDDDGLPCSSLVYGYGPLLEAVQMLSVYLDSKSFVDKPLKNREIDAVLADFEELKSREQLTNENVKDFVNQNFLPIGSELVEYRPPDWKSVENGGLPLIKEIEDEELKKFAELIHNKWETLGRVFQPWVSDQPTHNSLIPVPYPFIIPGGRFREIYYWDSFWIIQGLLVSGMHVTARGMILNCVALINRFGHVPNGNRIYYMKRSQPPFLALMVDAYRLHRNVPEDDRASIISEVLPALEREHAFWMKKRAVSVTTSEGETFTLNVYRGGIRCPRPESYREDKEHAHHLDGLRTPADFFTNVAAGCESGWDFSTRWLDDPLTSDFGTIRTEDIVPVDLNAYIYTQEYLLSEFYELTGNMEKSKYYADLATERADAIQAVFWNDEKKMWRDYDLKHGRQREEFYIAHVAPLFARCRGSKVDVTETGFMLEVIVSEDIQKVTSYLGGFPCSFIEYVRPTCQWDYPNAWPPMQMMLIESFAANPDLRSAVIAWAQKWLNVVYSGFKGSGYFYEKYDVNNPGAYGGGGEYVVQEGFGWTNGGILRLLELFPTELTAGDVAVGMRRGTSFSKVNLH